MARTKHTRYILHHHGPGGTYTTRHATRLSALISGVDFRRGGPGRSYSVTDADGTELYGRDWADRTAALAGVA